MEEWQESTVRRWEAERQSRPTDYELESWERTVADIRTRYKLAEGHKDRAELSHRLATAYIKMEDYAQAMNWVEIGLAEGSEDWVRELQEDMALILYLEDRKEEAMAILDEMAKKPPLVPKAKPPKRIAPRAAEAILFLICPHCDADVPYGQLRCPSCGEKVDDKFTLVRATKEGRSVRPVEEVETHRIKEFTVLLTEFRVDYDDPTNFLTAHRVRFMGGEIVTVTERSWYIWVGLIVQMFMYGLYGMIFWGMASGPAAPPAALVTLAVLVMVTVLPFTLLYLYIVFPNLLGHTIDHPVPER